MMKHGEITTIQPIPQSLLHEEFGGRKYYRRGYREVLLGLKDESEILGNSVLVGLITSAILFDLQERLPKKKYWILVNEAGQYFDGGDTFVNDLAIIAKDKIKDTLSTKSNDVPPRFVIEMDVSVDPKDYSNESDSGSEVAYMLEKSERLLKFGVEGVAWVLSKSRKILLALPGQRPQFFDWTEEVPLFDGHTFCLQRILEEDGILPPSN